MSIAAISLIVMILTIAIGVKFKLNVGLVAFGMSWILVKMAGIEEVTIIKGFNSGLFLMILGVMFLFSVAQSNGTMELLAKKIIMMVGKKTFLIPIVIYLVSILISAIGPGAIPTLILMSAFSMSLAKEMKVSPFAFAPFGFFGTCVGGVSPLATNGIIIQTIAGDGGFPKEVLYPVMINMAIVVTLIIAGLYVVTKGYKINIDAPFKKEDMPPFNKNQLLTLLGIVVTVVLVFAIGANVGLVSFLVAAVLLLIKAADEKAVLAGIGWSTLVLVTGFAILMFVVTEVGGIKLFTHALSGIMNRTIAPGVISLTASIMALFTSVAGVVLPTTMAMTPDLIANIGNGLGYSEMVSALTIGAHVAGISPFTGGALILASYETIFKPSDEETQDFYKKLLVLALASIAISAIVGLIGFYRLF